LEPYSEAAFSNLSARKSPLALVEASVKQAADEQEGEGRKHMQNIAKRLKSAKKFHGKINELLNNPIVKKLL